MFLEEQLPTVCSRFLIGYICICRVIYCLASLRSGEIKPSHWWHISRPRQPITAPLRGKPPEIHGQSPWCHKRLRRNGRFWGLCGDDRGQDNNSGELSGQRDNAHREAPRSQQGAPHTTHWAVTPRRTLAFGSWRFILTFLLGGKSWFRYNICRK
jgi:hypothetical protein